MKKRLKLPQIKNKKEQFMIRIAIFIGIIITIGLLVCIRFAVLRQKDSSIMGKNNIVRPEFNVKLLTVNPYSRPGTELEKIKGIVVHYTANPGSTAMENRNYFEGLKDSHITKASSHFIISLDGEIVQCIPSSEIAYASNKRNADTISIECCHPDESGKFTEETYDSLISLTAWLCCEFKVDVDNVIRHYDVTKKLCPKYYVEHADKWKQFKKDVEQYIEVNNK